MARYTGKKIRLGEALVLSNAITEEQLQQALEEQKTSGKKLGELLIDKGLITEDLIAQILGAQLGYPIIDLSNITISPDVQNLVPSSVLKKSQVLPIEFAEDNINILRVAMADPLDVNAMDDISIITGCQIEPLIATPRSVMVAIDKFYGSDEVASALEEYAKEKFGDDAINEEINEDINNSPIVVLVKEMIEKAKPYAVIIATGASAIKPRAIKGSDRDNVFTTTDILNGSVEIKNKKVAVIGSGMTGLETSELLCENGNDVTIVEMASEIAPGTWMQHVDDCMPRLLEHNTKFITGHKLVEIDDTGIVAVDIENENIKIIRADYVILSLGVRSENSLATEARSVCKNVLVIGDAGKTGRIADATAQGYEIGKRL